LEPSDQVVAFRASARDSRPRQVSPAVKLYCQPCARESPVTHDRLRRTCRASAVSSMPQAAKRTASRHFGLQLFKPVQDDGNPRSRRCRRGVLFDHHEPLTVGRDVIRVRVFKGSGIRRIEYRCRTPVAERPSRRLHLHDREPLRLVEVEQFPAVSCPTRSRAAGGDLPPPVFDPRERPNNDLRRS
jgi:hypothetical protein